MGWASLAPGAELAARLENVDLAEVPDGQIVEVLRAASRQMSRLHAMYWAAMVEVGRRFPVAGPSAGPDPLGSWRALDAWQWGAGQIGAALTLSRRRADVEYGLAQQLIEELPLVWQALSDGEIDPPKAKVFAGYLINLTPEQVELICRRLLPHAPRWTTGQLAHRLLREIVAVDPRYTRRRYEKAARERGVWGYLAEDGTAVLSGHGLSPTEAAAAAERLERLAAAVRAAGHPHTEAQLRADLFVRLLDGRYTGLSGDQIVAAMLADPEAAERDPDLGRGGDVTVDPAAETASPDSPDSAPSAAPGPVPPAAPQTAPPEAPESAPPGALESAPPAAPTSSGEPTADPAPVGEGAAKPATRRPATPDATDRVTGPRSPADEVAGIEVRVGLGTLLGLDAHPAELPGWGLIHAAEARRLVGRQYRAEWRFAVVDDEGYLLLGGLVRRRPSPARPPKPSVDGGVVEIHVRVDVLMALAGRPETFPEWAGVVAEIARRYADRDAELARLDAEPGARFPSAGLRRHVQLRDRTCVAPGCRRPAGKADLDHTRDHARGGLTVAANVEPLCLPHHMMKHRDGWTLSQPEPGRFCWRSPLGQTYRTRGEPIAPGFPRPCPGPAGEEDDAAPAGPGEIGPIFHPSRWDRLHPPDPPPAPGPLAPADDGPPPF